MFLHTAFHHAALKNTAHIKDEFQDIKRALDSDAFRAKALFEPIFGPKNILAHEALARPEGNGQAFPIQALANKMYRLGFAAQLDTLTALNALKHAREFPLTLNISVESALSEKFWNALLPRIARFSPQDIIFEILEHDVHPAADTLILESVRGMGYRFALDDFGLGGSHNRRLQVFGDYVDFIKIDGAYLQKLYVHDPDNLKALIKYLNMTYPKAALIAEHVRHFDQAAILFAMGFAGVQGRDLSIEIYQQGVL